MEASIGFVIAMILQLTFALKTGWRALSCNRKYWPWFVVGLFLPFIGIVIILCLPVKVKVKEVQQPPLKPVSDEEIFDQVLELEIATRINGSEIQFLARA